jgi:hypothetical protein
MNEGNAKQILETLVDQQLSCVSFVQDYLQLDFDGRRLTINTWPIVILRGREFRMGDDGYRDALCASIGKSVVEISETEIEIAITFEFARIVVSLVEESKIERVIFEDSATKDWAWW